MALKILVADDDDGYRYPIVNMFQDFGYEVLEASTQIEVESLGPQTDVWVLDVRMPTAEMEGIIAVHNLVSEKNVRPRCSVIFMSVLPESVASTKLKALKDASVDYLWIEKPFELEFLLQKVQAYEKE